MYWTPVVVGLGSLAAVSASASAGGERRAIGDVLAGAPSTSTRHSEGEKGQ